MRRAALPALLALAACYPRPSEVARTPTSLTLRYDPAIATLLEQDQQMVDAADKHCRATGFIARQSGDSGVALGLRQRRFECVRAPRTR